MPRFMAGCGRSAALYAGAAGAAAAGRGCGVVLRFPVWCHLCCGGRDKAAGVMKTPAQLKAGRGMNYPMNKGGDAAPAGGVE